MSFVMPLIQERQELHRRCQVVEDRFLAVGGDLADAVAYGARLCAAAIKSRQAAETFALPQDTDPEWFDHALENVLRPDALDALELHPSWTQERR